MKRSSRNAPMLVRLLAIASLASPCVLAEMVPQGGPLDPRIRTTDYRDDQVYRLYGSVGYHLEIEFEGGETFSGLSLGDPQALIYSAHDNVLTLRPTVETLNMNVTVTTSKRRYYFLYTVAGGKADALNDPMMYVVRFRYPPAPPAETPLVRAQRIDDALSKSATARQRNTNYTFCGSPAIQPIEASDDGVQTRIRFAARQELPAIFVRNADGTESLLNFSIDERGDIVIHRIAQRFNLRRGRETACVVNHAYKGSGEALNSHTLSPEVERSTRWVHP